MLVAPIIPHRTTTRRISSAGATDSLSRPHPTNKVFQPTSQPVGGRPAATSSIERISRPLSKSLLSLCPFRPIFIRGQQAESSENANFRGYFPQLSAELRDIWRGLTLGRTGSRP